MQPQLIAAWIAASVAILSTTTTVILQVVFRWRDQKEKRRHEILQHRKEALLAALQVIDHIYANTPWGGQPATNPHKWDITLARDAMNKMIIYCKDPDRVVRAFSKAVGLRNPDTQAVGTYGPADPQAFRRIVCEELEMPVSNYDSKDTLWIGQLPGTDSRAA
jgi:hypothetical protein